MSFLGLYIYTEPFFIPINLDLIKFILTKDFSHFMNRGTFHNKQNPLTENLFNLEDEQWKSLRSKSTPTFTSGKMKTMFQIINKCAEQMNDYIDEISSKNMPLDIKEIVAKYTTDVIGSCAFGLDCNSFKDPNSEFRKYGKEVFKMSSLERAKLLFGSIFPRLAKMIQVKRLQNDTTDFFMRVIKSAVKYREDNGVIRNDFLQILIDMKNKSKDSENIFSLNEIAANSFVFFIAGFETSSSTVTFCLFELASNQEIQERLRDEIHSVLKENDGEITYENVMTMKYLGQVVDGEYISVFNLFL